MKTTYLIYIWALTIGVSSGWIAKREAQEQNPGKQSSDSDSEDLHRFVMEHGLWTPDPRVLLGPYEEEAPRRLTNARFITANNTFSTVQVGSPAALRCQISRVADHETVSWIRRRDHHLITLGYQTYTNDERYYVSNAPPFKLPSGEGKEWTLHIKYAQTRDAGEYECQLSAHPPIGIIANLMVIQTVSEITGAPDLYVQEGSDVTLWCRLRHFTVPPDYVFWYHGEHMINYDAHGKVTVVSRGGESKLKLLEVTKRASGNYTCVPANAQTSSINLHVIKAGETPAAMQGGASNPLHSSYTIALATSICLLLML